MLDRRPTFELPGRPRRSFLTRCLQGSTALLITMFRGVGAELIAEEGAPPERPLKFNKKLRLGALAPIFTDLSCSDGGTASLADFFKHKILVLLFTSLRCPMSKKYRERFDEFAVEYAERGVRLLALSVETARTESIDAIRQRLRVQPTPYPWLHDRTQQVGRDYGAFVTPQVVVLDSARRVAYAGAWDDHPERPEVVKHYVLDAVEALLAGRRVLVPESLPKGCDIEYRDDESPAERTE